MKGFKYPASMGFTGSTGSVTQVSPHVRRRAFANGGYVRQSVGDPGSAMVRRARPSTEADREFGGKTPLAPGFRNGGRMGRMMRTAAENAATGAAGTGGGRAAQMIGRAMERAKAQPASTTGRAYTGGGALGRALAMVAQAERAKADRVQTPIVKGRFYEKGGKVVPRRPKEKEFTFMESVRSIPKVPGAVADYVSERIKKKMYSGQRTVEGRNESVDERVARTQHGYAKGGMARSEAKQAVKKHVNSPAPKGHKGLKKMCD